MGHISLPGKETHYTDVFFYCYHPHMSSLSNRNVLSVSDLTRSARLLLEGEFPSVFVEGEISNFSKPASGHWYFTLKDDKSQLRSAMFKGRNSRLRFVPRNGLQVIVRGKISLYEGRGDFQMIAEHMEEAGDGALRRAFEKLKQQLDAEGLFDLAAKHPIPALPQHLAIITSPTGAAIRDVLQIFARRFPGLRVTILPVPVQGDDASPQIAKAIDLANQYADDPFDAILLTRGGGSLEDLWAFNTEPVARAIFASRLPIVSAVGHEIDTTIADFVADLRAPTPSAAAELLSPDQASWLHHLSTVEQKLSRGIRQKQLGLTSHLNHVRARLRHPGERLNQLHQRFDELDGRLQRSLSQALASPEIPRLANRLEQAMQRRLTGQDQRLFRLKSRLVSPGQQVQAQQNTLSLLERRLIQKMDSSRRDKQYQLENVGSKLNALSPLNTLGRGYSIVTRGTSSTDVVTKATQVNVGETITARLLSGKLTATVTSTELPDEE
ncbi:MAG: exodeoxyribonuclease VII large subunit [Candidatus Azotimanducaceae bacterium]